MGDPGSSRLLKNLRTEGGIEVPETSIPNAVAFRWENGDASATTEDDGIAKTDEVVQGDRRSIGRGAVFVKS